MTSNKLMDLIYDKLADNYGQEQFDWRIVEDMCLDMSGEPKIAIIIDDVEYVLSIKTNGKNEREVYEQTREDRRFARQGATLSHQ